MSLMKCFLLLVIVFATTACNVVRTGISDRMIPIMEAYRAAFSASHSEYERAWDKADGLLEDLSHDNSAVADEASVTLLCYYLGEHTGEKMLENVVARGPRVLPYLMEFRKHPPILLRIDLELSLLNSGTRYLVLDEAIKEINEGRK